MVDNPDPDSPVKRALASGMCGQCNNARDLCGACTYCTGKDPCCRCRLPSPPRVSSSAGSRGKSTKKGRAVIATILFAAIVGSISAGEVELEWNDPQDERIDGYSIGYGTEFGSYEEIGTTDADARTFMVTGLEDCAVYFFSIVATSETAPDSVDAATVAGWPSMTVTAAHRVDYPVPGKRIFFIFGSNYMDGVRVESFDEEISGEVVGSNCTSTMILLSVPVGAHGVHDLRLVNPDQTFVDFTVRLGQPLSAGRSDSLEVSK